MDGIKPLALTFIVWIGAQLTTESVPTNQGSADMLFPVISSALVLSLLAAGVKWGRLQARVDSLHEEIQRLRKKLDNSK